MTEPVPQMLTPQTVADLLAVSPMTVYRLIEIEELRAYRIGRSLRIDPRDLKEYVQSASTIPGRSV